MRILRPNIHSSGKHVSSQVSEQFRGKRILKGVMRLAGAWRISKRTKSHFANGQIRFWWVQCSQCPFTSQSPRCSVPKPYLGACCIEHTPISKYVLTMRFRHQRIQRLHSKYGDSCPSPSLYRNFLSLFLWFSERGIDLSRSLSFVYRSMSTLSFRTRCYSSNRRYASRS